ncbi:MAG: hypothetical protein FWD65_02870 [Coriobacteriia bacterium]|nr:hypothetical protein [Coriobacteriia bacterium]
MRKKSFLIILVVFLLMGCNGKDTQLNKPNFPASVDAPAAVQPVISEGEQYKVVGDLENGWHYYIYDRKGDVVDSSSGDRVPPDINYVSSDIIEIRSHGGTYADVCKYYDVTSNQFSEDYDNPFLVQGGKIVYYDAQTRMLTIRDIFDKSVFYKEYKRNMSWDRPPLSIKLDYNDRQLTITYYDESDVHIKTETLKLN